MIKIVRNNEDKTRGSIIGVEISKFVYSYSGCFSLYLAVY